MSEVSSGTETVTTDGLEESEVTYNGSDNNYLSELYIEDIDLTQDFQKDKTTYFATVDSDIDEIEIVATAENDDSIVCIYGNEDLEEGVNKILVSVTAENGNVRTYRIYVTKN